MLKYFSAIAKSSVDSSSGIISRVSVLTEGTAKGHNVKIDATTLSQVKACAETSAGGVKVKVNHDTGFEAITGVLKNFTIEGNQLFANLHLLKAGDYYAKLLEMAQTIPESFGLSVCFSNLPVTIGNDQFARCLELYSIDLVDQPAANPNGLFSIPQNMNIETLHTLANTAPKSATVTFAALVTRANETKTTLTAKVSEYLCLCAADREAFCMDGGRMEHADFSALNPAQKTRFCRDGGRVNLEVKRRDMVPTSQSAAQIKNSRFFVGSNG